jgi:hypothetical protein
LRCCFWRRSSCNKHPLSTLASCARGGEPTPARNLARRFNAVQQQLALREKLQFLVADGTDLLLQLGLAFHKHLGAPNTHTTRAMKKKSRPGMARLCSSLQNLLHEAIPSKTLLRPNFFLFCPHASSLVPEGKGGGEGEQPNSRCHAKRHQGKQDGSAWARTHR